MWEHKSRRAIRLDLQHADYGSFPCRGCIVARRGSLYSWSSHSGGGTMIESCGNSSGLGENSEFKSDLIGGSNLLCLIHAAFGQLLPSVGVIWPHPHHPIGLSFSTCIKVPAWRAFGVSVGLAYSGYPEYFVTGS